MTALFRGRFHLAFALFAFMAAACSGGFAFYLLADIAVEHGSAAGNVLVLGLGLMALIASAIVFIFGYVNWKSSGLDSPQAQSDRTGESPHPRLSPGG